MKASARFSPFFYAKIFEESPAAMLLVTCEGIILKVNRQARLLLESDARCSFIPGDPRVMEKIKDCREFRQLNISVHQSGRRREYRIDGCPIQGRFRPSVLLTFQDITDSQRLLKQLAYQASHDSLTGALDRRAFMEKLNATIAEAVSRSYTLLVLYVDINGFKQINSAYGHEGGDTALVFTVQTIAKTIGKKGVVGRLGGDEFAVCMHAVPSYSAISEIILKLTSSIRLMEVPYKGQLIPVRASYGASLYSENGEDAAAMLNRADQAMYRMKEKESTAAGSNHD